MLKSPSLATLVIHACIISFASAQITLTPDSLLFVGTQPFGIPTPVLHRINSHTGIIEQSLTSFTAPNGQPAIVIDGITQLNGDVFVGYSSFSQPLNPGIGRINLATGIISTAVSNFFISPGGLATNGTELIAGASNEAYFYSPTTGQPTRPPQVLQEPGTVLTDIAYYQSPMNQGFIWGSTNILGVSGVAPFVQIPQPPQFIDGLDYDATNNLIWLSRQWAENGVPGSQIQAYTPSGQLMRSFFYPNLALIGDLVYIPIPAPAASGLFLAGALLATRRRR